MSKYNNIRNNATLIIKKSYHNDHVDCVSHSDIVDIVLTNTSLLMTTELIHIP